MEDSEIISTLGITRSIPWKIVVAAGAFLVPFSLGHPQPVVGTVVNAALFGSAILLPPSWKLGFVILPSLAVILRGMVFGPFTPYLLYLSPFIWLGNLALVRVFAGLYGKSHAVLLILIPSVVKTSILFAAALVMVNAGVIPKMYLMAMGPFQLATAIAGGVVAQGALRFFHYGTPDKRT